MASFGFGLGSQEPPPPQGGGGGGDGDNKNDTSMVDFGTAATTATTNDKTSMMPAAAAATTTTNSSEAVRTSASSTTTTTTTAMSTSTMMIDDNTPWMAATEGNIKLLQESLKVLDLPLTVADDNGYTLLHAAASYNQLGVLNFIWIQLQGTAEEQSHYVNLQDTIDGDTALHYCECIDSAKFLIETCGASSAVKNSHGLTPIQKHQQSLKEQTSTTDDDNDAMDDDDDDSDNEEEIENLKVLIEYLSSLER